MKCTANIMWNKLRPDAAVTHNVRCERDIGHAGLHRVVRDGTVYEFDNRHVWFPHYSVEDDFEDRMQAWYREQKRQEVDILREVI